VARDGIEPPTHGFSERLAFTEAVGKLLKTITFYSSCGLPISERPGTEMNLKEISIVPDLSQSPLYQISPARLQSQMTSDIDPARAFNHKFRIRFFRS
jgi:hypothetical protein